MIVVVVCAAFGALRCVWVLAFLNTPGWERRAAFGTLRCVWVLTFLTTPGWELRAAFGALRRVLPVDFEHPAG